MTLLSTIKNILSPLPYGGRGLGVGALAMLVASASYAQDDVEYKWEVGGGLGTMTYMGDFGGNAFMKSGNTSPAIAAVLRRVFNPYSDLKMQLGYGKVRGRSKDMQTFYPDFNTHQYKESAREDYTFSNSVIDLNATYEYNFWPYGTGREYRGAKRLTPYMAIGLGFTFASVSGGWIDASQGKLPTAPLYGSPVHNGGSSVFTMNMPVGLGVKYKVGPRLNLTAEWLCHFTLSDKLDGVKDPYRLKSDGLFKNTDCYSTLQVGVTYSFGPKCRTCMNSDWHN